jgi:signal transduction histidine kinase
MDTVFSKFRIVFIRSEFRMAWILFAIALGAFLVSVVYVPYPLVAVEAGFTVVIIVLAFAVAYHSVQAGVIVEGGKGELDSLIASVIDPLIIYNVDFKVTFFNAAAEQLFHLNAQTVIGHVLSPRDVSAPGWQVLTQAVFPSLAPRVIAKSHEGEHPQIFDLTFTDPELELCVITSPILDKEGKTTGFLKIIHDETPQAAALRSKTEFVTIASHQFRGPMTDISWALQALSADASMSETSKAIVNNALAASQGLIRRIEDLLNVAKMEEGRAGYAFEDADIADFVGKVIAEVLPATHKAGIKVYFDRPTEPLPHVMIDSRQLSVALVNLLENAIRYNVESGEVFVRVDRVEGKPFVRVSVRDTGIGIPPEAIDKLFKKFFRADNALQSQTEGSGLGLYIAKSIVNAHGGELWAESELGRGTIMQFTLPTDPNLVPKSPTGL